MSRELCRVYFISAPSRPVARCDALHSRPRKLAPAPTLFTFTSEPTACEILFLRQSEMRLAVNWVYDGIKYACTLPLALALTSLLSRFIAFINSVFALLFSRLILSHLNVPTDRSWNEILFLTVRFYSDSLNFIHIFRSWSMIYFSIKKIRENLMRIDCVIHRSVFCFFWNWIRYWGVCITAGVHRHAGGNCIVTVALPPLFPKLSCAWNGTLFSVFFLFFKNTQSPFFMNIYVPRGRE